MVLLLVTVSTSRRSLSKSFLQFVLEYLFAQVGLATYIEWHHEGHYKVILRYSGLRHWFNAFPGGAHVMVQILRHFTRLNASRLVLTYKHVWSGCEYGRVTEFNWA